MQINSVSIHCYNSEFWTFSGKKTVGEVNNAVCDVEDPNYVRSKLVPLLMTDLHWVPSDNQAN